MRLIALLLSLLALMPSAMAQEPFRIGLQESGTVQWEIEAIRLLDLPTKHGFDLVVRQLADSRAGQIALQAGEVDMILSDFVWVSAQRAQGGTATMVPHSLAVGGLMVPQDSAINSVEDLSGTTLGVAGGPADKSWVILQAYYSLATDSKLVEDVSARYGAPPLVNELLGSGGIDAALNFWQWNARAKLSGANEVLSVATMLKELGVSEQPPLLGWTFTDEVAAEKSSVIASFLDASFEAKAALLQDDELWQKLRPLMGVEDDDALFERLRDDYRAGIVSKYDPTNTQAAQQTFALLAEYGGKDLVGDQQSLAAGTFWQGYRK